MKLFQSPAVLWSLAVLTTCAVGPVRAQSADQIARVRSACEADARALCANIMPGGGRILACLQQHAANLSAACHDALPEAEKLKNEAQKSGKLPQ